MTTGNSQPSVLAFTLALAAGSACATESTANASTPVKPQTSAVMPAQPHVFHYNPWADLMRMQALLENPFNMMNTRWMPVVLVPPQAFAMLAQVSKLQHTADGYSIEVPLPGFKAEDIHVRLDGQLLVISAQTSSSETVKLGQEDEQSQSSRSFAETLTLPGPVQASGLKENFKDGVLTVTIPAQKGSAGSS